jgi:hypothetical protein
MSCRNFSLHALRRRYADDSRQHHCRPYVISIFVGTYTRFMAVFAKDVLNVGPDGLGLLMAAPGVGAVLSLIVLGALEERWSRRTLLWVSAKTTPLLLFLFCLSRNLWLSGLPAWTIRRHADHFSHREPTDHSSRSAAGITRARDERVSYGPGHAIVRFDRDGRFCRGLRRGSRSRAHFRRFNDPDSADLLAFAGNG